MTRKIKGLFAVTLALAISLSFFVGYSSIQAKSNELILATTTSTQDSGLLDLLIPVFEKQNNVRVKTIAVGSGQAMKLGEKGEADVLLVHSPAAEEKFMSDGFGSKRLLVMHNDFIIVGPANDPAGIKKAKSAKEAFSLIASNKSLFLSRGDNSGTNTKELALWKSTGISTAGASWYQQTGQGMGQTLAIAAEKKGYTLADRGTFLAFRDKTALVILTENDSALYNVYHVITVNAVKWPQVNSTVADKFAAFMVSTDTQNLIKKFGVDKYGQPLFIPDAGKKE